MSQIVAMDNICLRPSARWAHTEYSLEYHKAYVAARTGRSPDDAEFHRQAYDRFAFDFRWNTNDGMVDWWKAGRMTDMGHAAYAVDGSDQRAPSPCPFRRVEDVWEFDAVAEYGLPDPDRQVQDYEARVQRERARFPDQLTTGGYYRTIVSGAIAAFGWDMFLLAAAVPEKMERVFDGFFRRTRFHMDAWSRTSADVIIQHDDFVWTGGAFMHPRIYREMIIPRYAALWKLLHAAGKKVLFCSDGDFTEFTDDIAAAGADGFIFEPCVDFGRMADRYGQSHCLVGSCVDCRDLTLGKWEKVRAEIDATLECLARCRGAIVAVGNHLPANIPDDMLDRYFDYLIPRLAR